MAKINLLKRIDRLATEDYSDYCKRKCSKRIQHLKIAFHENDKKKIRKNLLFMMVKVGSPRRFKDCQKFFDTFKFSNQELCDITGCENSQIAKEKIATNINELLSSSKYKFYWWICNLAKLVIVEA